MGFTAFSDKYRLHDRFVNGFDIIRFCPTQHCGYILLVLRFDCKVFLEWTLLNVLLLLAGDWSVFIYFYSPIGIMLIVNLIFFTFTSVSLHQIKKGLSCHEGRRKVSMWRRNSKNNDIMELSKISDR